MSSDEDRPRKHHKDRYERSDSDREKYEHQHKYRDQYDRQEGGQQTAGEVARKALSWRATSPC